MPFKRLPADRVSEINETFAKISQTLRLAEKEARKAIAMRSKTRRLMRLRQKEEKELELRALLGKRDAESDTYDGADEQLDKIMKTDGFKPDKSFTGTSEKTGPRDRPVEFEKEADPFGLDEFLTEFENGIKALEKVRAVVQ